MDFFKKIYNKPQEELYLHFLETGRLKLSLIEIRDTSFLSLSVFQTKKDAEEYHSVSNYYLKTHKNKLQLKYVKYKPISDQELIFYKIYYQSLAKKSQIIKNNSLKLS